jgi:ABC-2 type transport system permease protein
MLNLDPAPQLDLHACALPPASGAVRLSRRVPLSALEALFRISTARLMRGWRVGVLCLIFALPVLFAVLAQRFQRPYDAAWTESVVVFGLIPQALLPLAALLFASGMVLDDVEEQTLTYLLIRPIPRWLIYLVKVAATWTVAAVVTSLFTAASLAVVYWGTDTLSPGELAGRSAIFCGLLALSLFTYTAMFGTLSLVLRRSLVLGVAYIVIFEGVLANIGFAVRRLTVLYYVRTLSVLWLDLPGGEWSIDPATGPGAVECLSWLAGAAIFLALLGSVIFSAREFRVKTPESS